MCRVTHSQDARKRFQDGDEADGGVGLLGGGSLRVLGNQDSHGLKESSSSQRGSEGFTEDEEPVVYHHPI